MAEQVKHPHLEPERGRTVPIVGEVTDALFLNVLIQLRQLDREVGDIHIVLNSEGGLERAGYAIYDAIKACKNKVVVEVYGGAFSIAAVILQAADQRLMAPEAQFMVHNGTIGSSEIGDGEELKQDSVVSVAEQIKKDNRRYYRILSERSQQPLETVETWCKDETFFDAEEAVLAGFADAVIVLPKSKPKRRKKK